MAFRDDRDALHARNEALEGDLDDAQRRLDEAEKALALHERKDVRDARDLKALRKEVDQLRSRLGMAPKNPPNRLPLLAGAAIVVLMVAAGVFAVFMVQTSSASETVVRRISLPEPPAVPVAVPAPPEPVVRTPHDVARFGAEVISVEGLDVSPGDGCQVDARLSAGPNVDSVQVTCGDSVIYQSGMDGGVEMTMHESNVREIARAEAFVYVLSYGDTGQRTGPRPQLRVRGREGLATLSRDNDNPFRLTLHIDDLSYPRFGRSLSALGPTNTAPAGVGFRLRAVATSTTGAAPTIPAEGCEVVAHPDSAGGNLNCRILVRCGADVIYGAGNSGYNHCSISRGGGVESAADRGASSENSDPILQLNRDQGTLRLADDTPSDWEIQFRLEHHPACSLAGEWSGALTQSDGSGVQISMTDGVLAHPLADSNSIATEAVLNCDLAEATLIAANGERWEGVFGPGYRTLIGRVRGGEPKVFSLRRSAE